MVSYIYFQNEQYLLDRFFIPEASKEDIQGLELWRNYIGKLISYLNTESESEKQETRETTIADLRKISDQTAGEGYEVKRSTEELIVTLLLQKLRQIPPLSNPCPRLFISHRQSDWLYALRIAHLATINKFAYWIDIFDPYLTWLNAATAVPPKLIPILTACVIEMAIINCTHVIACMTRRTRGSLWVPYEYGRITKLPGYYQCAGAWRHPRLAQTNIPEYMQLGVMLDDEKAITNWLQNELKLLSGAHCGINENDVLEDVKIPKLPESDTPEEKAYPYELIAFLNNHNIGDAEQERSTLKLLFQSLQEKKEEKKQQPEDHLNAGMALDHDIKVLKTLKLKRK